MSAIPNQRFLPARDRIAELEGLVNDFLSLDSWEDDLLAPPELIRRARHLVERRPIGPTMNIRLEGQELYTDDTIRQLIAHINGSQGAGLSWSPTLNPDERVSHAKALELCRELRLGGFTDWRLPTIQELLTLVNYERVDPAIDTTLFPDTKSAFYWSASPCAGNSDYAWGIDFYYGHAYWADRLYVGFVRAVRGPVSPRPGQ